MLNRFFHPLRFLRCFFLHFLRFGLGSRLGSFLTWPYFKEQISNLADIFLFVMYFLDDPWIRSCNLGELFIGGDIGNLLKFRHFISLLNVELLDCAFLNFLPQIREIELDKPEIESQSAKETGTKQFFQHHYTILIKYAKFEKITF